MHSDAVDRVAAIKRSQLQLENEVNVADCPAEEAVVNCVTVPVTVAVVPDAVFEKLKEADPNTAADFVELSFGQFNQDF
jgi:hypothetical protein